MTDKLFDLVRDFAKRDAPKEEFIFVDKDVNEWAATPLSANRCIKVTFEYSDIQDQALDEMCLRITGENRQELVV
jgi:hypothetical protein